MVVHGPCDGHGFVAMRLDIINQSLSTLFPISILKCRFWMRLPDTMILHCKLTFSFIFVMPNTYVHTFLLTYRRIVISAISFAHIASIALRFVSVNVRQIINFIGL